MASKGGGGGGGTGSVNYYKKFNTESWWERKRDATAVLEASLDAMPAAVQQALETSSGYPAPELIAAIADAAGVDPQVNKGSGKTFADDHTSATDSHGRRRRRRRHHRCRRRHHRRHRTAALAAALHAAPEPCPRSRFGAAAPLPLSVLQAARRHVSAEAVQARGGPLYR